MIFLSNKTQLNTEVSFFQENQVLTLKQTNHQNQKTGSYVGKNELPEVSKYILSGMLGNCIVQMF